MALDDVFRRSVNCVFTALRAVSETVTYHSRTPGAYDPVTGQTTVAVTDYTGEHVIISEFPAEQVDGRVVLATDHQVLLAGQDLAFTPTVNDTFTRADGTEVSIVGTSIDPAGALWTLQGRAV